MARLFKRKGSPYWWVEFRSAEGWTVRRSTKRLHKDIIETNQAAEVQNWLSGLEKQKNSSDRPS